MNKHYLLTLTLLSMLLCITSISQAKDPIRTIEGIVINVSDGDSIQVKDNLGTKVKVRLYGIDAPEAENTSRKTRKVTKPGQFYGEEARIALGKKLYDKKVKLDVMDIDKYRRLVSIVYLDGKNINQEMVAEGCAWAYRKYLDKALASDFIQLEEQAKAKRLGLWQYDKPEPPWEFRKRIKKSMRDQVW